VTFRACERLRHDEVIDRIPRIGPEAFARAEEQVHDRRQMMQHAARADRVGESLTGERPCPSLRLHLKDAQPILLCQMNEAEAGEAIIIVRFLVHAPILRSCEDHTSSAFEHAPHFAHRAQWIRQMLEHLDHEHGIERLREEGKPQGIAHHVGSAPSPIAIQAHVFPNERSEQLAIGLIPAADVQEASARPRAAFAEIAQKRAHAQIIGIAPAGRRAYPAPSRDSLTADVRSRHTTSHASRGESGGRPRASRQAAPFVRGAEGTRGT